MLGSQEQRLKLLVTIEVRQDDTYHAGHCGSTSRPSTKTFSERNRLALPKTTDSRCRSINPNTKPRSSCALQDGSQRNMATRGKDVWAALSFLTMGILEASLQACSVSTGSHLGWGSLRALAYNNMMMYLSHPLPEDPVPHCVNRLSPRTTPLQSDTT
nr:hypothetical protein CFP56_65490 [Quercus suber]